MPGGAASNDSNDKRSIACDSQAILRDQLCNIQTPTNTLCTQTYGQAKSLTLYELLFPLFNPSFNLFSITYFTHSFYAILYCIAGVTFSLHVVASCNFLVPYRFHISICSASSGSLYTEMGYNKGKDWVFTRLWNFYLISVHVGATKTSNTKPLWFTKTISSPLNCFATSCRTEMKMYSRIYWKWIVRSPCNSLVPITNMQQSESCNAQTAWGWSAHQLHLCLMSACGKSFISFLCMNACVHLH